MGLEIPSDDSWWPSLHFRVPRPGFVEKIEDQVFSMLMEDGKWSGAENTQELHAWETSWEFEGKFNGSLMGEMELQWDIPFCQPTLTLPWVGSLYRGVEKKNISNAIEVARSCSSLAELKELAQEWCELQGDFVSSLQQLFNWTGCPVGGRLGTTGHCPWDSVRAKIDGGLTMFNGLTNRHSDICIYVYMYICIY